MRRKMFDRLMATAGFAIAAVLLVAGGLLGWAHHFVDNQVHSQLAAQQIYFPAKGSAAISDPAIQPYLDKYAGQQLTTGPQAKAFADHYIAVHLNKMGGGKTYAQLSAESMAQPKNTQLAGLVQTVFRGETLRGMLLNAYAFGTMGTLALYGAIVSFIGAAAMIALSALGLVHARQTDESAVLGRTPAHNATVAAAA
jgi:hypothetical protein